MSLSLCVKVSVSRFLLTPLSRSLSFSLTLSLSLKVGGGYMVEDAPDQSTVKSRERRILPPSRVDRSAMQYIVNQTILFKNHVSFSFLK